MNQKINALICKIIGHNRFLINSTETVDRIYMEFVCIRCDCWIWAFITLPPDFEQRRNFRPK